LGFVVERRRGSHVFYRNPDGRTTTVPHHPGRDLARPLVLAILDDIRVSPEDFRAVLQDF
jgi:predicted RNA binding protein YcfA (HicA-like mRNA interferase family)